MNGEVPGKLNFFTAALLVGGLAMSGHAQENSSAKVANPPRSPAYANTTWPSEHADAWRTHAADAGLNVTGQKLRARSATLPPCPVWGYTSPDGKIYVLGGTPYLLGMFTALIRGAPRVSIPLLNEAGLKYSATVTPYVAQINPKTMAVKVLELTQGTSVNYTGGMLVHANGYLYAVARCVLYKINPATFGIVASVALPLAPTSSGAPNDMTAYNGMQATDNGNLILKGWASSGGGDDAPGIILRVDQNDLSIKAELVTSVIGSPRMVIARVGGKEYLYFPGQTQTLRYLLQPTAFVIDDDFSQTYLTQKGSTTASSQVFMGKGVVFSNNTDPTSLSPMHVFTEAVIGSPLQNLRAFTSRAPGWNFFMMAGDPYKSGIAVVQDQLSGHVAGYATRGGLALAKLWENDTLKSSAGMAIDYKHGELYTDTRRNVNGKCRLYLVVLDLQTGREKARIRVKGTKPSLGQIFIGPDNAVYYTATDTGRGHGYVTRVTAP